MITVASLGLAQLLGGLAILLPRAWGQDFPLLGQRLAPPFDMELTIGTVVFDANDVIAMIVAPLTLLGLAMFLRMSSVGMAIRASADSADRAALLGVPVKRLQTLVWSRRGVDGVHRDLPASRHHRPARLRCAVDRGSPAPRSPPSCSGG